MAVHHETVVVTTAGLSHTDDRKLRMRRYAITQAIRISCFVLAVALPVPLVWKLVLVVGAFTLPWFGVVAANAGPVVQRASRPGALVDRAGQEPAQPVRLAIEPGRVIDQD